ncbi:hypothetical protein [Cohnella rhizosphaerae]|uniref:Uncharacterized protein n=1 Tax=Cohnella rhizosphaerae TaxID=1457232 RepID=A0A9X4L0U6_9BACL|nr:hypothetical protein [Cohnella rhizosphaerae]MDG0814475.1 hypothetical protein [Cohnella rhizosphaerae]
MKKLMLLGALAVLLPLQGCRGDASPDELSPRRSSSPPPPLSVASALPGVSPGVSPASGKTPEVVPHLEVTAGTETVTAQMGSYCWTDRKKGVGQCADAAVEPTMANVKRKPRVNAGDIVTLAWSGAPPDEMRVTVSFPDEDRPAEALEAAGSTIRIPAGEGDRLFVITATWPGGTVPYYFGVSASADEEADALRKIAWEAMPEGDRASVVDDWREADVSASEVGEGGWSAVDGDGKLVRIAEAEPGSLITVTFRTTQDGMLGPMVAVFDRSKRELIGWLLRY